jgi:phosphoglycerol transferase MdoB-like AlkP superfamily enzyme
VLLFYVLFAAVALLTRLALLVKSWPDVTHTPWTLAGTFLCGLGFDLVTASYAAIPLVLYLALAPRRWMASRLNFILIAVGFFLVTYVLLFNAVAEWFFWDEFGARFNFIAVDYLVYTTEVIANIRESYPMPRIFGGLFSASVVVFVVFWKWGGLGRWLTNAANTTELTRTSWKTAAALLGLPVLFTVALSNRLVPEFGNTFNQELAKNGLYSFAAEFRNNELRYDRFYDQMDHPQAFARARQLLGTTNTQFLSTNTSDLSRLITHDGPAKRWNVMQITVESLSAKYLGVFGNEEKLTPNLDALARDGMLFTKLYATGNRTVRGMEALTLAVPPTPGQSIVKRPNNENLFSLGSVFRARGYDTKFIYGGYGYFDNMNYYFGHNGYDVVDRAQVPKEEITFANAWGACDEDSFHWAIKEADASYAKGKPFHHFVMTTSNHRPFTYPEGKIDLPSKTSGRRGGVKYTDYAIGKLIEQARTKPWFTNTIFVIVADHCAGSAGKSELPVKEYEIPMIIYNPQLVGAQRVEKLCSQMDVAPTILGLLNWTYKTRFYGQDVRLMTPPQERALIANYQKLGLLRHDRLEILKPVRQQSCYQWNGLSGELTAQPPDQCLLSDAVAYYQTASHAFRHRLMGAMDAN